MNNLSAVQAAHVEAWLLNRGEQVPPRNSQEWRDAYERWIDFSFGSRVDQEQAEDAVGYCE